MLLLFLSDVDRWRGAMPLSVGVQVWLIFAGPEDVRSGFEAREVD